jgi:hypothetical protein
LVDQRRLKLTSICTVCTKSFIREVGQMKEVVASLRRETEDS